MPKTEDILCPVCSAAARKNVIISDIEGPSPDDQGTAQSTKSSRKTLAAILGFSSTFTHSLSLREIKSKSSEVQSESQEAQHGKRTLFKDIKAPFRRYSLSRKNIGDGKGPTRRLISTGSTDPLLTDSRISESSLNPDPSNAATVSNKPATVDNVSHLQYLLCNKTPADSDPKSKVRFPVNSASRLYRSQSLPADSAKWNALRNADPLLLEALNRETAYRGGRESWATMLQHYYPEGGWGWVILTVACLVTMLCHGLHSSFGIIFCLTAKKYGQSTPSVGWLGAMTTSVALFLSPLTIAVCKRKSTRLTAVLGGLVTALGCLFTSFASQYHQLFFSYGTVIGIGVGMTRDSSSLMVGQYFKRKREFVEIFVVSGSGLGISVMSAFVQSAVSSAGWRLGLQAVTGAIFLTFLLGTFYRSASLYHPQRRAILHLKNQKRKVKEKNRLEEKPPLFDITTLKSRTIQILLVSISLSSFGITTPIIYLAHQAEQEGLGEQGVLLLQTYLGLGWVTGCCAFGFLIVQRSSECRMGRQYLCQAALFLCGVSTLAFTAVEGYHGYVLFAWLYGIFCGGFHYTLKMFTYEKVRARNFARTWGYVQCSQAIPTAIGIPITGYINVGFGNKAGYYFSSTLIIFGSMTIFLIDIHRRNAARHRHKQKLGAATSKCSKQSCPEAKNRRDSLAQFDQDFLTPKFGILQHRTLALVEGVVDARTKQELTCISEEGIADMDLPDHILEELEYLGDCITSCDKVENYLMMSEYENNLVKTSDLPLIEKRGRRRLSSIRQSSSFLPEVSVNGGVSGKEVSVTPNRRGSLIEAQNAGILMPAISSASASNDTNFSITGQNSQNQKIILKSGNLRTVSVIEEVSV